MNSSVAVVVVVVAMSVEEDAAPNRRSTFLDAVLRNKENGCFVTSRSTSCNDNTFGMRLPVASFLVVSISALLAVVAVFFSLFLLLVVVGSCGSLVLVCSFSSFSTEKSSSSVWVDMEKASICFLVVSTVRFEAVVLLLVVATDAAVESTGVDVPVSWRTDAVGSAAAVSFPSPAVTVVVVVLTVALLLAVPLIPLESPFNKSSM